MSDEEDRTVFRPLGAPPPGSGWTQGSSWGAPAASARRESWASDRPPVSAEQQATWPPFDMEAAAEQAAIVSARPERFGPAYLVVGGGLVMAIAAWGAILFWPEPEFVGPGAAPAPGRAAALSAERAVAAALPGIGCSWLSLGALRAEAGGLAVNVHGAAGHPVTAQNQVEAAAERAGARVAVLDFSGVAQINPSLCGPVQAFSATRDGGAQRLSMPAQPVWEIEQQRLESEEGWNYAQPPIEVNIGNPSEDFALFGLEGSSGRIEPIIESRAQLDGNASSAITRLPNDRFRLAVATGHTGWSGILLVTGRAPFDPELFVPADAGDAGWSRRFAARAAERGWKTQMLWYKVVDELPNAGGAAAPAEPAA